MPAPTDPCRTAASKLTQLKRSVTRNLAARYGVRVPEALIRRAVDEAAATAAAQGCALLWLPVLAEEVAARSFDGLAPVTPFEKAVLLPAA